MKLYNTLYDEDLQLIKKLAKTDKTSLNWLKEFNILRYKETRNFKERDLLTVGVRVGFIDSIETTILVDRRKNTNISSNTIIRHIANNTVTSCKGYGSRHNFQDYQPSFNSIEPDLVELVDRETESIELPKETKADKKRRLKREWERSNKGTARNYYLANKKRIAERQRAYRNRKRLEKQHLC